MRNPCTTTESSPRSPQLEKSLSSSEDPAQPKISKQWKKHQFLQFDFILLELLLVFFIYISYGIPQSSLIFFSPFYFRMTGNVNKNKLFVLWWLLACTDILFAMASETEKTHALLQTCSTESLLSSLGLGLFCTVADRLLQFPIIQQNTWLRALSDNSVHCVIGMWSWAIVIGIRKKTDFGEIILAGFLASVIDIDHFLLSGSLSLKVRSLYV